MARRFFEDITDWSRGAITATSPDRVPKNASPRSLNVAWLKQGYPAKRKGLSIITQAGETGTPAIMALGHFSTIDWTISDNGRWSKIVAGAFTPIDAAAPTPFTSGYKIPSTAIAKNLLFAVNGTDATKTNGTLVQKFGIAAPAVSTAAAGAAGNPNGSYTLYLTALNSNTGAESSLSAGVTVSVAAQKITLTFPATVFSTDTQITHVRAHIFKLGLTDIPFRLTNTNVTPNAGAYDATYGGYTSATASLSIDVTDADINNLIIKSPGAHDNDPPPTGATYIAYHGSRMFATDGVDLWYSDLNKPESFSPDRVEPINPSDGQRIIGFATLIDHHLVIWKERSTYKLTGPDDPNTWEINPVDLSVGLKASRSIVYAEGELGWEAEQGKFRIKAGSTPEGMDANVNSGEEDLNYLQLPNAIGAYDSLRLRILFADPEAGQTNNTGLFPYNTALGVWEDKWDPMDVSAMGILFDSVTGAPYVAVGNYKGRVFRLWQTPYVDGVRINNGAGTDFTLTGAPTSATAGTITDTLATFDTTGGGLSQIPVILVASDGSTQRAIIASNSGTVLTLVSNLGVVPDTTWTYYIGCPNFEFDTKYLGPTSNPTVESGTVFNSRRFKQVLIKGISDTGSADLDVYCILDHVENPFGCHVVISLEGAGALWDIDFWDDAVLGTNKAVAKHHSLGVHGKVLGFRIINREPTVGVQLLGVGLMGTELSYKD